MKLLAIIHIYYPEIWPQLKACLKNITLPYDLIVTFVEDHDNIVEDIMKFKPDARIMLCDNRGYDVGPFMQALKSVCLDDYTYLIKLHTKRDILAEFPPQPSVFSVKYTTDYWRKALFSFIASQYNFEKCIESFENDKKLGMINQKNLLFNINTSYSDDLRSFDILERMNFHLDNFQYVAGTMFLARAELFKCLQGLEIQFSQTNRKEMTGNAHIMERVLGGIVYGQGMYIADTYSNYSPVEVGKFYPLIYPILRFFIHKKITNSRKKLIKICKIPVYRKQI